MQRLADIAPERLRAVRLVCTDIDDTLTIEGRLPAAAYAALEALECAGIAVVPITGRPAGWCDLIARLWPVAGVVGENGAFYFAYDRIGRRMHRRYVRSAADRALAKNALTAIERNVLAKVPGSAVASDQAYREADLAIDFAEDVAPLSRDSIAAIVAEFESAGATAKVSSIHVNGWFGDYDKLTTTRLFVREIIGVELDRIRDQSVFVGDSPNDAPMFAYFTLSFGVANVRDFADSFPILPAFIANERGGDGFVSIARTILDARA